MAAVAKRRIERRDAKTTAPIVIILILLAIVVLAWLLGIERKRRRRKREYEEFVKSLPVLRQPNVAVGVDVGNAHGQSPLDYINERYFGRDNHFSSAQRHFDDWDDPPVAQPSPAVTNEPAPVQITATAANSPGTPHTPGTPSHLQPPPPSYTDSNNSQQHVNIPPPSYQRN